MNKGYKLYQVIIIIIITSIVSGLTVGTIFYNSYSTQNGKSYHEIISDSNFRDFINIYSEITTDYYDEVEKEKLINGAINGMINVLPDSYTSYLTQNESTELIESLNGKYYGIGITIKGNTIVSIIKDSPAHKKGLKEGDLITKVNNTEVSDKNSAEITSLITEETKKINLEISRNDEILSFELSLEELPKPNSYYEMLDNNTGYLYIELFAKDLDKSIKYSLEKLENMKMNKLIVDLRGNSGGYLEEAQSVASLFLEKGKLIYSLKNKQKTENYNDKTESSVNCPIVVLIDEQTASAAEIFACALKDSNNAVLIGNKSYGKGKVQHTYKLKNGNIVKYTTYNWLRPNGNSVDKVGIIPDIEINNEYTYSDTEPKVVTGIIDKQIEKAKEYLNNN